jgi:DNA processing protein
VERDAELLAWMVLARAPRLNAALVRQALSRLHLPSAAALLQASPQDWQHAGFAPATRDYLRQAAPSPLERRWIENPGHALLPFTDAGYPRQLLDASRHPLALYVLGNSTLLNHPQLAIVGSRNPSAGGRDTAFQFAGTLAVSGLTITSGLAQGIDGAAHRGALAAGGSTIGVLGSGVDLIYPRVNRALSEQIACHGAVISEFALGAPPRPKNFPRRNATIARLALGTLVVEATPRSGSLLTARLAREHNRTVFAVPGSIHNPLSRGCHQLIRQGATIAESAADILSELNFSGLERPAAGLHLAAEATLSPEAGMDKNHKILLDALGFDPTDLDTLVSRSGLKPETVSSMMLILELKGHVQAAPGGRFSRVRSRGER